MTMLQTPAVQTASRWLPGYLKARLMAPSSPVSRIWVAFADHFEPEWRQPDRATALERVRRWRREWPRVAERHLDSAGRPACYTFFYPEEQYEPELIDELSAMCEAGFGDVEVHLHHDADTEHAFVDRMERFLQRLHHTHGLLRLDGGRIRFGFIHGNWALDNSLPDGRYCGLNNEITLLRDLGCYADFTLPSAPSPAQTRIVNTIYWATDDPARPRSHDAGVALTAGGPVAGDLLMIPGPLTLNLREWRTPLVPRLERGEIAGNCLPTRHRARLWARVAPRLDGDVFIKLFGHGAPEKNATPLLEQSGALDRTLRYLREESNELGAELYFVSAWQMWTAVDAIRRGADPRQAALAARPCKAERTMAAVS
jgi:hypothetical protein